MAKKVKYSQKQIDQLFSSFSKLKVLVIGDVMLDHYMIGSVTRISPEAPVPVVNIAEKQFRLGGAANVLANLQAMGAQPIICSVVGDDIYGSIFIDLLEKNELVSEGLIQLDDRKTTVKTRVIGNNHQLIRIDEEQDDMIDLGASNMMFNRIREIITERKIDVIIFEDYDKGLLSESLIKKTIALANAKNIPSAVDPKKRNFMAYKGCTLFKPNLKELREGLKIEINPKSKENIKESALKALNLLKCDNLLLTLSENGVYLKNTLQDIHIPAHLRNIADVSGAGDTVISIASLCLAANTKMELLAELSNMAGGLVCEKVGVVPVDKEHLRTEAVKLLCN
jgi:rfaE bifunctional protein kinase chain/domain